MKIKYDPKGADQPVTLKGFLFSAFYEPTAEAATGAIKAAAELLKVGARADVAAAGFSARWQNTIRVNVYPTSGGVTVDAAAYLFSKISYAGVFEEGAVIHGKPMLWLPLPATPKRIGNRRFTPASAVAAGIKLVALKGARAPLLGAEVSARTRSTRFTAAQLKRAATSKAATKTVPLFVGVPEVDIGKKFHIAAVADSVRARLPELYVAHLRA